MQGSKFKYLNLSKENMKFSAAHFLIFDDTKAERLHGHNYRVKVDFKILWNDQSEYGYGVDFSVLKKLIKGILDQWDEHILLPAKHKDMKVKIEGDSLDLRFRERHYVFPKNEVVLLPVVNTSVELLSELLCQEFWAATQGLDILGLEVQVEETLGQSARSHIGDW
jgi:6-pyruvoyltetrahydropterin/6-carboxytetrahydropterin synthase